MRRAGPSATFDTCRHGNFIFGHKLKSSAG